MQVFQSWADVVIMLVIAIAYIWTAVAQAKVIRSKNETIQDLTTRNNELERTNRASLELSEGTGKAFESYKSMLKIEDIQGHIDRQVEIQLSDAVNKVLEGAAHEMVSNAKVLERAVDLISADLFKFCQSSLNMVVYLFYQLNFNEANVRGAAKTFYPDNPKAGELMMEEYVRLKIRYPNGISQPEKQIDQKKD